METKNIQESKVNFQTAVLAKELGFDEICYYHFGIDGEEFASRLPDGSKNSNWAKCTARPTLAHLQTWLRENYDIHVFCVGNLGTFLPNYDVIVMHGQTNYHREDADNLYDDALTMGLNKGLRLLKAILEKQKSAKTQL